MNRILLGALAGLAATAPMTLAMKLMHEALPEHEQYPLPPRRVTEGMAEKAGVGFGVAVWAGSYLGWLPAAGIISPATEHPPRRNALMIAAHVVWGAAAGMMVNKLADGDREKSAARS